MSVITDYNTHGKAVFIVTTTTFVLATVFVTARLVSRFAVLKSRTVDDWCIIFAWGMAFGLSFAIDWGTSKGLGQKDTDIPESWFSSLRRSEYAFTILYNPALMATKTSILIFYLRMSKNTQRYLRAASYVTLGLVNVSGVVLTFLNAFQCTPPSDAYDSSGRDAKCISIVTLFLCSAPVNIITDLAILVLPIPVLTGMRLPQRQKTVLVFTFALGIFVTIVDVVRVYYLQQAVTTQQISQTSLREEPDFAWNVSIAFMWSAVEVNVGIICACVPTLKPLMKKILPSMLTGSKEHSGTEKQYGSFSSHVDPIDHPRRASSNIDPTEPVPAHVRSSSEEIGFMDFLSSPEGQGRPSAANKKSTAAMDFLTTHPDGGPGIPNVSEQAEVESMDFLTTADGLGGSNRRQSFQSVQRDSFRRPSTAYTHATDNTVYFGFVNMRRPKSMLTTKGKESFKYCALVTILFFLWGFSYGLLNTLNDEVSAVAHFTQAQALGLSSAYFGAYFFGALTVGQWVLRHVGFKATFITGLCIYGTGTLMFWPSAVLLSYPGFILSQSVVGFGLAVLETAANPFIALCGPPQYAEYRLLYAQSTQAVASVLSQILAEKALFTHINAEGHDGNQELLDVQWTYLAIALFVVILALFFYYMPLPEASDEDLQAQAEDLGVDAATPVLSSLPKVKLVWVLIGTAVFSQLLYVAAQECFSVFFGSLLQSLSTVDSPLKLTTTNYTLIGHTLFALSRFLCAPLTLIIRPRHILLIFLLLTVIFSIIIQVFATTSPPHGPNTTAIPILLFFFAEGPIFPLIYAIALRGIGTRTKMTAAAITASCVSGAGGIWILWAVTRIDHRSIEYSFAVMIALAAFGCIYPAFLSAVPRARKWVDPKKIKTLEEHEDGIRDREGPDSRASSFSRRFSKRFSVVFEMVKGGGAKGSDGERGEIEHRER